MMFDKSGHSKKIFQKKGARIAIIVVALLVIVGLIITIVMVRHNKEYKESMSEGQRCLQQKNFDVAEDCFQNACNLHPNRVEPYECLVRVYGDQRYFQKAYGIYCEAYEEVGNPESSCRVMAYELCHYMYEDVISEYEDALRNADSIRREGAISYIDTGYYLSDELYYAICDEKNLVVAYALEDIDLDEECELLIADITDAEKPFYYCALEITDDGCIPIFNDEHNYFWARCQLTAYDDGTFLVCGSHSAFETDYDYYAPKGGEMVCVERSKAPIDKYENKDMAIFRWYEIEVVSQNEADPDEQETVSSNPWDYFIQLGYIENTRENIEKKVGELDCIELYSNEEEEREPYEKAYTGNLENEAWITADETKLFSFDNGKDKDAPCIEVFGTAEELLGISENIDILDLEAQLNPETEFMSFCPAFTGYGYCAWFAKKELNGTHYYIRLFPEAMQDWIEMTDEAFDEDDTPLDLTPDEYTKYVDTNDDARIIYPSTYIAISECQLLTDLDL